MSPPDPQSPDATKTPPQQYAQYGDPSLKEAAAEPDTAATLERLGIARPELPEEYKQALGARRAAAIEGLIADKVAELARDRPGDEELSRLATEFGPAARALDQDMSRVVAVMEAQVAERDLQLEDCRRVERDLSKAREETPEADRREIASIDLGLEEIQGEAEEHQEQRDWLQAELDARSQSAKHPDAWAAQYGDAFVGSLAARHTLGHERRAAREQADQQAPSQEQAAAEVVAELPGEGPGY